MTARTWQDWSCTVRVLVGQDDDRPDDATAEATADATADAAAAIVRALMADVDRAVSRFRTDSEIEAVNAAAPRLRPVRPLTLTLVRTALNAARRTDGAVDPTVGRALAAWGYDTDIAAVQRTVHALATVGAADPLPDWGRVMVDAGLGRVGVARGLRLDLGATAKAWTADEAARRVAARYRLPALVEIGGDVAVAGPATDPWLVRVAETADGPGETVGLTHGGLATSSTAARRWRTAGGEAHHVIDPRTGAPADGVVRSATVWAPSCVEANTFSTAALVWGGAASARLALAGVTARLVERSGAVRTVGDWPAPERAA